MPTAGGPGPNFNTVWAEKDGQGVDQRAIRDNLMQAGNPNRFTEFAGPETPKEDPRGRTVALKLANQDWPCKVCGHVSLTMEEFDQHCRVAPGMGNGREMACEVALREKRGLAAPALQGEVPDAGAVAGQVADALAPALNRLADVLGGLGARLGKLEKKETTRAKKEKKEKKEKIRARAGSVSGTAPSRGPASLRRVGQPEVPLVDRSEESETPPTA